VSLEKEKSGRRSTRNDGGSKKRAGSRLVTLSKLWNARQLKAVQNGVLQNENFDRKKVLKG
jgi:hypothetical protein